MVFVYMSVCCLRFQQLFGPTSPQDCCYKLESAYFNINEEIYYMLLLKVSGE